MHRVILIDDEPLARALLKKLLESFPDFEVIAECSDGFEGFKTIQETMPDLIFLDVQMPRINGFEMLELIENPPAVIFTTAFDSYALLAFENHAIDYLLKPITKERFEKAIQKWLQRVPENLREKESEIVSLKLQEGYQQRIVVKDQGAIKIIPAGEIQYIEASDDYIKIYSAKGKFLKKATLQSVTNSFDPALFVRVHRSFLIPVSQLLRIEPFEKENHIAVLHCGAKIPVSKSGMARLKEVLGW